MASPAGRTARPSRTPEAWWEGVGARRRARRWTARACPAERVAAVGLSGQVGTHVLLDRAGQPLRPAISWQDTRSGAEAGEVRERLGRERLAQTLGIDLPPGPAWPLPRLLWLQRHAPADLARHLAAAQAKDFVAYRLTGELATDPPVGAGWCGCPVPRSPTICCASWTCRWTCWRRAALPRGGDGRACQPRRPRPAG